MNCGPRRRFVVMGASGPMVVHNCENATQACARDVMASAMLRLHKAGFALIGSVHDEVLVELDDVTDFARMKPIFEKVPAWAAGLPIAADGYLGRRFKKG